MVQWLASFSLSLSEEQVFVWSNRVEAKNVEKLVAEFIEGEAKMKKVLSLSVLQNCFFFKVCLVMLCFSFLTLHTGKRAASLRFISKRPDYPGTEGSKCLARSATF